MLKNDTFNLFINVICIDVYLVVETNMNDVGKINPITYLFNININ